MDFEKIVKSAALGLALLMVLPELGLAQNAQRTPRDTVSRWQGMSIRTNLLWDALAEPNIGLEFPVGDHWSLGADAVYTHFNVGNVTAPFHMYPEVENNRRGWYEWLAYDDGESEYEKAQTPLGTNPNPEKTMIVTVGDTPICISNFTYKAFSKY